MMQTQYEGGAKMFRNLANAIDRKGLTDEKVAAALNIHRETLRRKMQGSNDFTLEEVRKLNTLFPEYSFDFLYAKEQSENPKSA
jgi:transcriptional regulator with XRE-family HTH domain